MRLRPRPHGKFITLRQAEAELGIPYARIYIWVTTGLIPRVDPDVAGQSILIRRTDLEQFIDDNMTAVRA